MSARKQSKRWLTSRLRRLKAKLRGPEMSFGIGDQSPMSYAMCRIRAQEIREKLGASS